MSPLAPLGDLIELLIELGREESARAARKKTGLKRPDRWQTLRPGTDTPLWNAVVAATLPHLSRRGAKALLARELMVPRQRVHQYFVSRDQLPDAERLLRLLVWLNDRRRNGAGSLSRIK